MPDPFDIDKRLSEEVAAKLGHDPTAPASGGYIPRNHGGLGHSPITIEVNDPPQQNIDPCATGAHRWAWLTAGGQACGRCGLRR